MPWPILAKVALFIGESFMLWLANQAVSENSVSDRPDPGEMSPPTADPDRPVPLIFGTVKIQPNVIWWGDTGYMPFTLEGNFQGYTYYSGIDLVLCWGPVDELIDLYFDNTRSLVQAITGEIAEIQNGEDLPKIRPVDGLPTEYDVDSQNLFGGSLKEGGIRGKFDFYWGTEEQLYSQYVQDRVIEQALNPYVSLLGPVIPPVDPMDNPNEDSISDYKNICHIVFKRTDQDEVDSHDAPFYWGVTPQLKGLHVLVRRCPDSLAMPTTAVIIMPTEFVYTEKGANAAHCIYECLTNLVWGLKLSPTVIDIASFQACAQVISDELLGISLIEDEGRSAYDLIAEFLQHVDGTLYTHPQSGLITMSLVRGNYDVADLLIVNKDNSSDLTYDRPSYDDVATAVKLTYKNSSKAYADDVVDFQNQATLEITAQESVTAVTLRGITNFTLASIIVGRLGRSLTQPFARARFTCNRAAFNLVKGDPFVFDYTDEDIPLTVMRVLDINYGSLEEGKIEITAIEDVFVGPDATIEIGTHSSNIIVGDPSIGDSLGSPVDSPRLSTDATFSEPIDGVNLDFVTSSPFISGTSRVFLNGLRQLAPDDYSEFDSETIRFVVAPLTGDRIIVDYIRS